MKFLNSSLENEQDCIYTSKDKQAASNIDAIKNHHANTSKYKPDNIHNTSPAEHSYFEIYRGQLYRESWRSSKKKSWDGKTPFYSRILDLFFNTYDEFTTTLIRLGINDPTPLPETYLIYSTEPLPLSTVTYEYILNGYSFDGYLPNECLHNEVLQRLDDLNKAIKKHSSYIYEPSKIAIECF